MIRPSFIALALMLMSATVSAQDNKVNTASIMNVDDFMAIDGSTDTATDTAKGIIEPTPQISNPQTISRSVNNNVPIAASPIQEKCITIMSGFRDNGHEPRYQFFKLTQQLTNDVAPIFRSALDFFGDSTVTPETPVTEVIENIANPVIRQAAPEITIGNMGYLIDFAMDCETYLSGQIESLEAFDPTLINNDFNITIAQDALFMRQILSDSLFRVSAQSHDIFGPYVQAYADNLVITRDKIEFSSFENELEALEALYLTDLDGRLARSNDVINNEMDREALTNSLEITEDFNQRAKRKSKETMLRTLSRILSGF